MSEEVAMPEPDVQAGIDYWANQPANYDGVLGEQARSHLTLRLQCDVGV